MAANGNGNGLTGKQKLFIDAYLDTFNATESARRAKYKGTYNTLAAVGHENLKKPKIAAHISERLKANHMGREEVATRLADRARFNAGEYVKEGGVIASIDLERLIADGHGHHIKGIKYAAKGGAIIEFYSAEHALDQLAKVHGMLREVVNKKHEGEIVLRIVED